MEKSGGFDMSKMSMAGKIVLGGGILLLIDSFLSWQKVCVSDIVGTAVGGFNFCAKASAWGGNGGFAGLLMGILLIVLVVWEGVQVAGVPMNLSIGVSPSKGTAYVGFAAVAFGLLKFIFAVTNSPAIFAWVGLVLIIVVAYGSWMKFQEPEGATPPPAAPAGGGDGGFSS
jgi:hypothetical protein